MTPHTLMWMNVFALIGNHIGISSSWWKTNHSLLTCSILFMPKAFSTSGLQHGNWTCIESGIFYWADVCKEAEVIREILPYQRGQFSLWQPKRFPVSMGDKSFSLTVFSVSHCIALHAITETNAMRCFTFTTEQKAYLALVCSYDLRPFSLLCILHLPPSWF